MIYHVYAIRDVYTGFLTPTVDQSDPVAVRNFAHAVLNGNSLMLSHPQDYDFYRIGEYDTDSGMLTPQIPPELVSKATHHLEVSHG